MSILKPFQALRPVIDRTQAVAAPPYDVVSRDEAYHLAANNPWNFLHVSRSEIDLPFDTDPYSEEVYEKAAQNFEKIVHEIPMVQDSAPSLYLYELKMGEHRQVGIAGIYSLDEYDADLIKKHERTRALKEEDRTRHILRLGAQTGPVYLTYKNAESIDQEVALIQETSPQYSFTAHDGVIHSIWNVPGLKIPVLVNLFKSQISFLYIADGHHRAAAASRVRKLRKEANVGHTGSESYNYLYAVAFPDSQLKILPYHRVVRDLNGMSVQEFLNEVSKTFKVSEKSELRVSAPKRGSYGFFIQGKWYLVESLSLTSELDVSVLQNDLLAPILKMGDPRKDSRIDFVGGGRGIEELEKRVNSGEFALAVSVHATDLKDVLETADRGGIMPPKSTWFEPKLCDGVLIHLL